MNARSNAELRASTQEPNFFEGLFQLSYVTNDLSRGLSAMRDQYGVRNIMIQHNVDHGPATRSTVALAWAGPWLIEMFEPKGDGSSLYEQIAIPDGETFRLHHLGHCIRSEERWTAVRDLAVSSGRKPVSERETGGFRLMYFDARATLGHFTEHVFPSQAGLDFLDSIPRN